MCGIAGLVIRGGETPRDELARMTRALQHRGPDDEGTWHEAGACLGNRRLAILDLSRAGHQPMTSGDGRLTMTYNGEVYNYVELRTELGGPFRTATDSEVVLEAISRWGDGAFPRFNGMFALAVWDTSTETLLLARDRFGVKPLYFGEWRGTFYFGSEVKALAAAGFPLEPDLETWQAYLTYGLTDVDDRTFFKGIKRLRPGHLLRWHDGRFRVEPWYDLAAIVTASYPDRRPTEEVVEQCRDLLFDAVRLRFRADVPVGVCLSGGLDSSLLVGALNDLFGRNGEIQAYHFMTGDAKYDETPWVRQMLANSSCALHLAPLSAEDVPELAGAIAFHQEEPFGGIPTVAMTELFRHAAERGTTVLLDAQGVDEAWAGYDYYLRPEPNGLSVPLQRTTTSPTRPDCLTPAFLAGPEPEPLPKPFGDPLLNARYQDICFRKIPRTLRFNDRASSQWSRELREPCLDYRLVELGLAQPPERLVRDGVGKALVRQVARQLVPSTVREAPKRAVQTPQREWLRGPLQGWVQECLHHRAVADSGWFDMTALRTAWDGYLAGDSDNSFYVWQWISTALFAESLEAMSDLAGRPAPADLPG